MFPLLQMCDGYKVTEDVREFGIVKQAIRCVPCGTYYFEPDVKQENVKCKHGHVMCGICDRVQRRKDAKGNK